MTTSFKNTAAGDLRIEIAAQALVLLPERALWWPAQRSLIVADVHLGKSSVFRSQGLAVPGGSTQDNLSRLSACLARYHATRLLCLGDLTHARAAHTPAVIAQLGEFREQHAGLNIELVRGNHDRHAGVPEVLQVEVVSDPHNEAPFSMRHEPADPDDLSPHYILAGHVHPAISLRAQHDRVRVPCFVFGERCAILPAFGSFTGMHTFAMTGGIRYYPVLEDRVLGPIASR